ncbi:MAG: hypothetical protein PHW53_00865 [Patescibacteria group bacterium]|nr:hypothetical protein [Patescibacteria group bacterium]
MKYNILQIKQIDETSCASADFTMVANALGLHYSLEDILKITKSEIGFAPFWKFLVEKNDVEIVDFSENNYNTWAKDGFSKFREDIDPKAFIFLNDRIANPAEYQVDLKYLLASKNFKFYYQKPTVSLLKDFFSKDYVCDVMLDPWVIYGEEPPRYSLHRVVILDINGDEIVIHDPSFDGEAFYKSDAIKFEKSFQIEGAELTCYKRIENI